MVHAGATVDVVVPWRVVVVVVVVVAGSVRVAVVVRVTRAVLVVVNERIEVRERIAVVPVMAGLVTALVSISVTMATGASTVMVVGSTPAHLHALEYLSQEGQKSEA